MPVHMSPSQHFNTGGNSQCTAHPALTKSVFKSVIVHAMTHMRPLELQTQSRHVMTVNTTGVHGLCFVFLNDGQPVGPVHALIQQWPSIVLNRFSGTSAVLDNVC